MELSIVGTVNGQPIRVRKTYTLTDVWHVAERTGRGMNPTQSVGGGVETMYQGGFTPFINGQTPEVMVVSNPGTQGPTLVEVEVSSGITTLITYPGEFFVLGGETGGMLQADTSPMTTVDGLVGLGFKPLHPYGISKFGIFAADLVAS